MSNTISFQQYLQSGFTNGPLSTDEVIEFVLPLFEEVAGFHDNRLVGPFENQAAITVINGRLDIEERFAHAPKTNLKAVQQLLQHEQIHGYSITERLTVDLDVSQSNIVASNQQIETDPNATLTRPVYLPGYHCYELKLGHHDTQTDIFCLGLFLGSMVMGLNLYDTTDLEQFANYRNQPAGINPRMHPTVCALVTEMTELNRADRSRDLQEIIQRLKYYRDYDPQRQTDLSKLAAFQVKKPADRKSFILSKLRNRLFDTSRRNRLLYYKPNGKFVNLTVSSVPMVLHFQSINPQHLFTWNADISRQIVAMKDLSLNKYLRFEDHPYLNSQLNSIRQQAENDKKEYGFSQLKLVVCFLHWHNLKEDSKERIQSPLLLLPVELEKKKSLKDERYTLRIIDNAAIINPILSNYLKDLYGIELPESIDFDEVSMNQFYDLLKEKIDAAKQGVKLNYIDKPRIKIIHTIARQTINAYRKRLNLKAGPSFHSIEYSYSEENYRPLGLELFRQKIEPKQSALEFLLNDRSRPASNHFAEPAVKSSFEMAEAESNPYSWDFDVCNIVLGNFNYKKMSLVSDYNKVAEQGIEHEVFNSLFSNEPRKPESPVQNNPAEWYHVIAADPTQAKAVLQSRTGSSYIIQGPPGTGKSQTITNLIADFLANGKSILFVCEKRAALDVVYHRLQKNQLAELCCYIHDSQGDKKEFIRNLKTVYEDFLSNKMNLKEITQKRKRLLQSLLDKINQLQQYHGLQTSIPVEAGVRTRQLYETLVSLKDAVPKLDHSTTAEVPFYSNWIEFGNIIQQLGQALEETGAEPVLASHPFSNLGMEVVQSENPFLLLDNVIRNSSEAIKQLQEVIRQHSIPSHHVTQLENLKNLIQDSVVLEPLAQSGNLKLVNTSNREAREFETAYRQYKEIQNAYAQLLEANKKWNNKFDRLEVEQAIRMAQQHEKSFFSFLNGNWRKLKKQLQQSYDFTSHQVKPTYSTVLEQLKNEYETGEQAQAQKKALEKKYRMDHIDTVYVGIEVLRRKQGDKEIDYLLEHPEANALVLQLSRLNNSLQQLEMQHRQCLYGYKGKTMQEISDELSTIKSNADVLKDLLPSLRRFAGLPETIQQFIRKLPLTPLQAEAAMANQTLQLLLQKHPSFAGINYNVLQDLARGIEQDYKNLLKLNSEYIRAERRQHFLSHYELSNTSVTGLNPEQRSLKKEYQDGRKILEHEMNKTMRYKSIRELASNESGKVLKDIKPVWLMSPLSVSDSLPLDTGYFDVVIFDEASQITLEEGIPALFRAPQSIIVGDDKQMPPSNFFTAKAEDPEDLEIIEGESEEEILSSEADSLLVQGSRKLNSTMLSWHYRSRYETLISYSNHAFYDAGLLTIPDKTIHHYEKPLLEIANAEQGLETANGLLSGSISFHYLPSSIYEARSNQQEAKYITYMLKRLLEEEVEESIGIVAFSQEQQGVIEATIEQLAATDKKFEALLEKAYNRKDDGQITGLFIKNLENVQGDERDIIIMSVCYGHDAKGKMLMNFGPINRKGGEKRLNVLFSRARKHMAVVSSIRHFHITNDYNDGANYFKRFLQYAELVSTGNMEGATGLLQGLGVGEKNEQVMARQLLATTGQLKKALETKGYIVDENIGQSRFRCTLGVKKQAADQSYSLGILVDDELHYQNNDLVEQYYQRPSILTAFGWQVLNVYAKDWLEDSDRVLQGIEKVLEGKVVEVKEQQPHEEMQVDPYETYLSAGGDRFWAVLAEGNQLLIRSGKVDTKGMVQVKSFGSPEEAMSAKEALVAEKLGEGFTGRG
jgi:superfamily I DNA and/or RNA helicase/predicted DNA-binding WGR domain protein/very-short-patch-repair endonuclease